MHKSEEFSSLIREDDMWSIYVRFSLLSHRRVRVESEQASNIYILAVDISPQTTGAGENPEEEEIFSNFFRERGRSRRFLMYADIDVAWCTRNIACEF